MRASRSREETLHDVVLLHTQGMSGRAIARALRLSRKTVKKLLEGHASDRVAPHLALPAKPVFAARPSKLDGHRQQIDELLATFPDVTAQRIFEEIRARGFAGGYTAVKDLVRKLRPKDKPKPSLATPVYGPGQMAECDWSSFMIPFTHVPPKRLQAFCYALVFSHRKRFGFYETENIHALMDGHVETFNAFRGVAQKVKYDCQKAVVLRFEGRQPIYNPRFIDFATYYEFAPQACRPGHPNDKPRVERSFDELARSFFNGRQFRDEPDLREQLTWWMANVCDQRVHKKSKHTAIDLFAEEAPHLRPLPTHSYDTARVIYRLCDIEGFVSWDGNRYSLPYEHVTDLLPVRITQRELFVYAADLSLIVRHELRPKGQGDDVEIGGHHPRSFSRGADLDHLRQAYADLGTEAATFLVALEHDKPRSAAYHARLILALRQRYATQDLIKAIEHAQRFGAFAHEAIERILLTRAVPRRLDEYIVRRLETTLGEFATEPRDLTEYDALPCWQRTAEGDPSCQDTHRAEEPAASPPSEDPSRKSPANQDRR